MTILTVSTNNTFGQWLSVTNQLVTLTSQLINGNVTVNGTIFLSNSGFSIVVSGSESIANNLVLTAVGGNTFFMQSSNAVVNGTIYNTGSGVGLLVSNTAQANAIITNTLNVNNNATVNGALIVAGQVVEGSSIIAGSTITNNLTTNNNTVTANLAVTTNAYVGNLTTNNTITSSQLVVSGNSTLTNLTVSGTSSFNGAVTALSTVNISNTLTVSTNANVGATLTSANVVTTISTTTAALRVTGQTAIASDLYTRTLTANNNAVILGALNSVGNTTASNLTANSSVNAGTDVQVGNSIFIMANTYLGGLAAPGSHEPIRADQGWQVLQPNPITFSGVSVVGFPLPAQFNRFRIRLENITVATSGTVLVLQLSNTAGSTIVNGGYTSTFFGYQSGTTTSAGKDVSQTGFNIMQFLPVSPVSGAFSFIDLPQAGALPQVVAESYGYDASLNFVHYKWHGILAVPTGWTIANYAQVVPQIGTTFSGNIIVYGAV